MGDGCVDNFGCMERIFDQQQNISFLLSKGPYQFHECVYASVFVYYDASCAHRRGRGDQQLNLTFFEDFTRPIGPEMCACIRVCIGKLDTDAWQPMVTSNKM